MWRMVHLALLLSFFTTVVFSRSLSNKYFADTQPLPQDPTHWDTTSHHYHSALNHYVIHVPSHPPVSTAQMQRWLSTSDVHYIPHHTFLVHATPKAILDNVPHNVLKRFHELHHSLKVSGDGRRGNTRRNIRSCVSGVVDVLVSGHHMASHLETSASYLTQTLLTRARVAVVRRHRVHARRQKIRLWLTPAAAANCSIVFSVLSHVAWVRWVESVGTFRPLNSVATWTIQSASSQERPLWARNITGMGMVVGVGDTGLDFDSCFFRDPNQPVAFYPQVNKLHRKVYSYVECINDDVESRPKEHQDGTNAHGTHVCGSVAGNALPGTDNMKMFNGMAYEAKIFFTDLTCTEDQSLILPDDMADYYSPAHNHGVRISSNSWGSDDSPIDYISTDRETDQYIYDHQDYMAVFAAGNQPSAGILSPAASKNSLTVGAHYNSNDAGSRDMLASFSARGPTFDQRIKPEIIGPGQPVNSARSDGLLNSNQCELEEKGGTSMATPHVAGTAVLARQYFLEGYYPTGTRRPSDSLNPSGSLMKAFMIHSGVSMGGQTTPTPGQGWGRLEVHNSLYFADKGTTNHMLLLNNATVAQHSDFTMCVTVNAQALSDVSALRVTLAWFDPATAAEGSTESVVNDLDIVVVDDSGTVTYSNNKKSFQSVDIVEQITIPHVVTGTYRVIVYGAHVPEYGPYGGQPFSVMASAPGIGTSMTACSTLTTVCPNRCSGHGTCSQGKCVCEPSYHHIDCSRCNAITVCHGGGTCDDASKKCSCYSTFTGETCQACAPGWFGPKCDGDCKCGSNGKCNVGAGRCVCTDGDGVVGHYGGDHCERCKFDWRGERCTEPSYWCRNHEVRVLTASEGWLQINGSPRYPNSTKCSWLVRAAHPSWKIEVTFKRFLVEDTYDFVRFYDGDTEEAPLLKKLTGHHTDLAPITSTGSTMLIMFDSDLVGDDEGLDLEYKVLSSCTQSMCNGHGSCDTSTNYCKCTDGYDQQTFCRDLKQTQGPTAPPPSLAPTAPPFYCFDHEGIECGGHGGCSSDGTKCICNAVHNGNHCENECPYLTVAASDVPTACNGHGVCSAGSVCMCTPPWLGFACQVSTSTIPALSNQTRTRYRMVLQPGAWRAVQVTPSSNDVKMGIEVTVVESGDAQLGFAVWIGADQIFNGARAEWNVENPAHTGGQYCLELSGADPRVEYYIGLHNKGKGPSDVIIEYIEAVDSNPKTYLEKRECTPHPSVPTLIPISEEVSPTKLESNTSINESGSSKSSDTITMVVSALVTVTVLGLIVIGVVYWWKRKNAPAKGVLDRIPSAEMSGF